MALQTTFDRSNYIHTSVINIRLVPDLVPMARGKIQIFRPHHKMFNVTEDKSQSPCNIMEYCNNSETLSYDDYLAIVRSACSNYFHLWLWLMSGRVKVEIFLVGGETKSLSEMVT